MGRGGQGRRHGKAGDGLACQIGPVWLGQSARKGLARTVCSGRLASDRPVDLGAAGFGVERPVSVAWHGLVGFGWVSR